MERRGFVSTTDDSIKSRRYTPTPAPSHRGQPQHPRFFCSLNLASGYWQEEIDAADREKMAFVTQGGLYEFRVMPFGLVKAPAKFERLME